jgi:hypothetical protein
MIPSNLPQGDIRQSPDGRRRQGVGILGRVISLSLLVVGLLAVAVGAILRPFLGRWIDARNIDRLRRHYALDQATAEDLYRLARRDGFGSAWETVVDGRRVDERRRADAGAETRKTGGATERRQTAGRRVADRHRA